MDLANVKVKISEDMSASVIVNNVELAPCLRGYTITHEAGTMPSIQLDIIVDSLEYDGDIRAEINKIVDINRRFVK